MFAIPVFRPPIRLGPEYFKTYQLAAPIPTHFQKVSCREYGCERRNRGFKTTLNTGDPKHVSLMKWIENKSGRKFTRVQSGPLMVYTFPPGQNCFDRHVRSLEREPIYVVRDGDHRGNPRGTRSVTRRATDWVDDFATHQQGIADAIQRG